MSCKQNQKALNEAAARGSELSAELHEHIGACSECRAAFAEDAALFAAIDWRVQQSVNAELPPSFLQRVQARLADEQLASRRWAPAWAAATALLLLVLGSTLVVSTGRNSSGPSVENSAAPQVAELPLNGHPAAPRPTSSTKAGRHAVSRPKNLVRVVDVRPLVSTEQKITTEQLIERIQHREINGNVLVSSAREEIVIPPIVVPPITPAAEDETPSEPTGSSRVSVSKAPVETR